MSGARIECSSAVATRVLNTSSTQIPSQFPSTLSLMHWVQRIMLCKQRAPCLQCCKSFRHHKHMDWSPLQKNSFGAGPTNNGFHKLSILFLCLRYQDVVDLVVTVPRDIRTALEYTSHFNRNYLVSTRRLGGGKPSPWEPWGRQPRG